MPPSLNMAHGVADAGRVGWLSLIAAFGVCVGLSIPFLYESALEVYAVALTGIVLAGIYLMPRMLVFRDGLSWGLFVTLLCLFCTYPQYISLQVSGLPWISPMRMVLALLVIVWLYALRNSDAMRSRITDIVKANRPFFMLLGIFIACQLLSIPTSRNPGQALQKFALFQLYWTFPLFVTLSLLGDRRRLQLFGTLLIVFALFQCLVGFLEARQERLLWLDYLPPGFGADSEVLTRILQGTFRAEGYRVQGSFTVSLVYAEFLAVLLPFALFAFVDGRGLLLRTLGLVTAIAILPAQYLSGSRLGMVGSITVFMAVMSLYVFRVWKADKRSMLGPFLVMLLPVLLAGFVAAIAASPRLRALTIGGGAQQASTDSRFEMWVQGIPRIFERPLFGHGAGLGAETLGFTNLAGVLTIDTYWLSALLEFGIVGFVALFGMVGLAIWSGARTYVERRSPSAWLGGPIAAALLAFVVIKLVLSQADNHLLIFVLMAMAMLVRAEATAPAGVAEQRAEREGRARSRPKASVDRLSGTAPRPSMATRHGAPAARVSRKAPPHDVRRSLPPSRN